MRQLVDYVVIGAGSAGCVVAEELSSRHSVALIEAGRSDRALEVAIPAAFYKLFKTERYWAYESEPEPSGNSSSNVSCGSGRWKRASPFHIRWSMNTQDRRWIEVGPHA